MLQMAIHVLPTFVINLTSFNNNEDLRILWNIFVQVFLFDFVMYDICYNFSSVWTTLIRGKIMLRYKPSYTLLANL